MDDKKTVLIVLEDRKSFESLTDHRFKGNSVDRDKKTPFGTTYQRYMWTEKAGMGDVEKAAQLNK